MAAKNVRKVYKVATLKLADYGAITALRKDDIDGTPENMFQLFKIAFLASCGAHDQALEKTRSHDREIQYVYENPCSQPWPPSYTKSISIFAGSSGRRHETRTYADVPQPFFCAWKSLAAVTALLTSSTNTLARTVAADPTN